MVEGSVTAVLLPLYVVADEPSANAAPPNSGDNASTSTAANAALKRFVDFMSSPPSTASRPSVSPRACICARSGFFGTLTSSWARSFPHGSPMPWRSPTSTPARRSSNARTTRNRASRQRRRRQYRAVAPPGQHHRQRGYTWNYAVYANVRPGLFRFRRWTKGRQGVV